VDGRRLDPVPPGIEELPPEVRAGLEAPPSGLRRAAGLLLRLLGIGLLALVLWKVPWRDQLHLRGGEVLLGRIEGDAAGAVLFTPRGEEAARPFPVASLAERERGLPAAEAGVLSLGRRLDPGTTAAVVGIVVVLILLAALRWRMLLRTQGIPIPVREAVELTLLGNFFNQVAPGGLVGGDVLKAIYTARGRGGAASCWVSVFVDRVVGLFGTVILACIALLPRWGDSRFHWHAVLAYCVLLAGIAGGAVVLSRRIRRTLRMEAWVPRLPLVGGVLAEVDQAVLAYRERKGPILAALAISVGIHSGWCLCNALLGRMLGIHSMGVGDWFAVVPPILVVSAIPLLPGGWGVGEASYAFFLKLLGVPAAPAVAVSILGRILQSLLSLPGGIVFLRRRV